MPSPFPGMDPYLEQPGRWRGFHVTFLTSLMARLNADLPAPYTADIEESVQLIETDELSLRETVPDVNITVGTGPPASIRKPPQSTATLEPVVLSHPPKQEIQNRWLEIRHAPDRQLVTVIELLSPTNMSDGRNDYLSKRVALMSQQVHLVEIDLLVGGKRLPMAEPLPLEDCVVMVSRTEKRPLADVCSWSIRAGLPTIPIPLRAPDADFLIALQDVFDHAYESGACLRKLDYSHPPATRLRREGLDWAGDLAKQAASR